MKKKTKVQLIVVLSAIVLGIGGFAAYQIFATESLPIMSHTVLSPGDLTDSISIRGVVQSVSRRNVHSTLNFTVQTVLAELGDTVQEGDVLAILDTVDLELNIRQQRAELYAMDENNQITLDNNRRIYNEARTNIATGQNAQVLNAESAYRNAATNLDIARSNHEEALADYLNPINTQLLQAQSALTLAQIDLENTIRTHENNRILFAAGGISRNNFDNSETALTNAQNRFEDAASALENAQTGMRRALDNAQNQLTTAQLNYDNAATALSSARNTANQELTRLGSNVEASQIAVNNEARLIAIERLERQLEDSIITAPMSGTITAVFATEGAVGSGLLFVIEDTENLKITTRIREYDAVNVRPGMTVEIRTDSTGSAVFEGAVSSIDPTAIRNAAGDIANLNDVEFGAEIDVVSMDTPLLIGMNTRLNVILEQREDVLFVPFDAVGFDIFGNTFVFTADISGGRAFARRVPVELGLETDFFVEIITPELAPGMVVLNNANAVTEGMEVAIN